MRRLLLVGAALLALGTHVRADSFNSTSSGGALPTPAAIGAAPAPVVRIVSSGTSDVSADTVPTLIKWTSTSAAPKSETLPACSPALSGIVLTVKDAAGTALTYPITVTGTIDGGSSFAININYASFNFTCDGVSTWSVN